MLPKTCNQDTWMQMFQYKILHRILATNSKLFLYKIFESPLCSFCNSENESILHLFCECDITTGIWQDIIDWLNSQGFNFEYLNDSQIILGDPRLDAVVNRILLTTKIAIFQSKEKSKPPTLFQVLSGLSLNMKWRFNIINLPIYFLILTYLPWLTLHKWHRCALCKPLRLDHQRAKNLQLPRQTLTMSFVQSLPQQVLECTINSPNKPHAHSTSPILAILILSFPLKLLYMISKLSTTLRSVC